MDAEELLNEAIVNGFSELGDTKPGSNERTKAVEDIATLYKLKLEGDKVHLDHMDKVDARDAEFNQNREQMRAEEKSKWWKFGLDAAGLVLPLAFYGVWMYKGLKFEETGFLTSQTFRGLVSKFRPTK